MERATVFYTPADGEQEVRPFFPRHWSFRAQEGDGLGERLQHAFGVSFQAGAERIVVIGTDCPYLGCGDIEQAWEALAHHDVVLGPANDGGYWLLGLKTLYSELFSGIFWGTEFVLEQTMVKAQQLGLKVALFRTLSDVDTMLDWQEFLGSADSLWSER